MGVILHQTHQVLHQINLFNLNSDSCVNTTDVDNDTLDETLDTLDAFDDILDAFDENRDTFDENSKSFMIFLNSIIFENKLCF